MIWRSDDLTIWHPPGGHSQYNCIAITVPVLCHDAHNIRGASCKNRHFIMHTSTDEEEKKGQRKFLKQNVLFCGRRADTEGGALWNGIIFSQTRPALSGIWSPDPASPAQPRPSPDPAQTQPTQPRSRSTQIRVGARIRSFLLLLWSTIKNVL